MTIIYIRLLDEGTNVFRPTGAEPDGSFFKVLAAPNYDPQDEKWEFPPGSLVKCEKKRLNGVELLVAVALHSDAPK